MSKFIPFRCSICQRLVQNEPTCSAIPVNTGRCCVRCDNTVVTPARLRLKGVGDEAATKIGQSNQEIWEKTQADPDWFLKEGELTK